MNSYEMVIQNSKRIESLLKTRFGATGNGLIELLRSIPGVLPVDLDQALLSLGRVRNKLVHEEGFELHDPEGFQRAAEAAIARLEALGSGEPAKGPVSKRAMKTPSLAGSKGHLHHLMFVTIGAAVFVEAGADHHDHYPVQHLFTVIVFFLCGINRTRAKFGNLMMLLALGAFVLLGVELLGTSGLLVGLGVGGAMWFVTWRLAVHPGTRVKQVLAGALRVARLGRNA